jgi:ABC-type dipeptide/oligopeptide/nickel transport system ATPase component
MLSIENLSVEYIRRGQTVQAVRNFSLTIGAGETVGLVGESGSGKSTVALAILRLIRAQEGHITGGRILLSSSPLGGEGRDEGTIDLLKLPEGSLRAIRGRRISMIFQDPFTALNPVMRVREQMEESSELRAQDSGMREALERVQLDPGRVLDAYPHQLSGGQRQRVMIAIALLNRPQLILADEPTTALDVLVQKDILDLLFRIQKESQIGMLFISHNLGLVAQYAQRIAVMKEGALVEEGASRPLFLQARHPYTRELIAALRQVSAF